MLAILRVRFDSNPDPATVWPDAIFHGWMNPGINYSLAHYWTTASLGAFDMRYVLFPPILMGDPRKGLPAGASNGELRDALTNGVVNEAKVQHGFRAGPFDQLLLWFAQPTDLFGMGEFTVVDVGPGPAPGGVAVIKSVGVAVVDVKSSFDSVCQEVGHAFGLEHPFATDRPPGYPEADLEYGSPYDVMSSQKYLGFASSFVRGGDARLPDGTGDPGAPPPQRVVGPLLSAAQLVARLPWLEQTPFAKRVPAAPGMAGSPLRVRALDEAAGLASAWSKDPFVAIVDTPGGESYTVELRRGRGYDAALGAAAAAGGNPRPATGLVVHHLHRPSGRLFYDGVLPLPASDGDLDWTSGSGRFTIRVRQSAADLSSADLVVGGADFWRQWDVRLEKVGDLEREEVVERRRVDVAIPCVEGTYAVEKVQRHHEVVLAATSYGFSNPGYSWTVNGMALDPTGSSVTFPAEVFTPDPDPGRQGGTVAWAPVTIGYAVSGARLTLRTGAQPGNFGCEVAVLGGETDPGISKSLIPAVRATEPLYFPCVRYTWEDAYEEAFRRCFDFGTRFREVEDLRVVIDPGDPPPYAVRPEELVDVLRLEVLAAAEAAERREEVITYAVSRYLVPESVLRERIKQRG